MTGRIELLVFGKTAEHTAGSWVEGEIVIVDARVSHKDGALKCIAESVEKISPDTLERFARAEATRTKLARPTHTAPESEAGKPTTTPDDRLIITIGGDHPTSTIAKLSALLKTIPTGDKQVSVKMQGTLIETTFTINPTPEHLGDIKAIEGVESIV